MKATWRINYECNFDCIYCWPGSHGHQELTEVGRLSLDEIISCFEEISKVWEINITGGEPFLYPGFICLLKLLTKNFKVSINTNLVSEKIHELINQIDPNRIIYINCSVHILEREKIDMKLRGFLTKLESLRKAGFPLRLSYVAHPTVLNRMNKDLKFLRKQGFDAKPKIFRGIYNGKQYPEEFSEAERKIIKKYLGDSMDWEILNCKLKFKGKKCLGGCLFFKIDPDGTVHRCSSYQRSNLPSLGNLFRRTFYPFSDASICEQEVCYSLYEGLVYAENINIVSVAKSRERILKIREDARRNIDVK